MTISIFYEYISWMTDVLWSEFPANLLKYFVLYLKFGADLAGVKVLHGLDKVMEGGAVVLTLKDQNILADGDINEGEISLCLLYFPASRFLTLWCHPNF